MAQGLRSTSTVVVATLLVMFGVMFGVTGTSEAHSLRRSFADLRVDDTPGSFTVRAVIDLDPDDFEDTLFARFDRDRSGRIDITELQTHKEMLGNLARAGMVIERGGERCPSEVVRTRVSVAAQMLRAHVRYDCPTDGALRVEILLLERMRRNHVHFLVIRQGGAAITSAHTATNPVWEDPDADLLGLLGRFTLVGVEHILIGYDHLLFLLALLVAARRLGEMVTIITAFTVAHSITLVAAGLGVIELPDFVVESAIALSIVAVGV